MSIMSRSLILFSIATSTTALSLCAPSTRTTFLTSLPTSHHPLTNNNLSQGANIVMKVSKGKSKASRSKGSSIALKNEERLSVAGRRGTKSFIDPNKIFIGNLAYTSTNADVRGFLREHGIVDANVVSVKIIRDWKTNQSKGYGFVQFMSPIFATSAMLLIRNKKLQGRVLRLDQGAKKKPDQLFVVKKKEQGLEEFVEELEEGFAEELGEGFVEEEEEGFHLDILDEFDDEELFADDDLDDMEVDGIYKEEFLPVDETEGALMNREQRRKDEKANKKRRKPGNGFGDLVTEN